MTRQGLDLQIEGVESNINQIKEMIADKIAAKYRTIDAWDAEILHLYDFLQESKDLLTTLKGL
jgi:hypothetical protein